MSQIVNSVVAGALSGMPLLGQILCAGFKTMVFAE